MIEIIEMRESLARTWGGYFGLFKPKKYSYKSFYGTRICQGSYHAILLA